MLAQPGLTKPAAYRLGDENNCASEEGSRVRTRRERINVFIGSVSELKNSRRRRLSRSPSPLSFKQRLTQTP